jgi:microsomal epoxide hydrolase
LFETKPNIKPFQFKVQEDVLENILRRVSDYPWHEMPDDGGWDYGTNMDYLKELCTYWVEEFDWRLQEAKIILFQTLKRRLMGLICISSTKKEVAKTLRL